MVALNEPLPLPVPSQAFLDRLATRRSAPAQALVAPGPSEAELEQILTLGARTPDHGKLFPWRFVVMGPQSRAEIAERLAVLAELHNRPAKDQAVLAKLTAAPSPSWSSRPRSPTPSRSGSNSCRPGPSA